MNEATNWDELITDDVAKWPVASTTRALDVEPDKFVRRYNVPVLQEHKRTIGGADVYFDVDKLREICAYCNKRIRDTGDYAGICVGHTQKGQAAPLIGFAGPFRLGWLNDEKTTPAILADFRIYADKESLLEEYPRRSPEMMYDAEFKNVYLDPIALLGAETPWADLGTCYAAGDFRRVDYEACAQVPGGYGNPFETKGRKKVDYQAEGNGVQLSPELQEVVRQLQEAVFESPEMKWIRTQMQSNSAALDAQEDAAPPAPLPVDEQATQPTENDENAVLDESPANAAPGGEDDESAIDYGALFGGDDSQEDDEAERRVDPDSLGDDGETTEGGNDDYDELELQEEQGDLTPIDEEFDGGEEYDDETEENEGEEMATNDKIMAMLNEIKSRLDRQDLAIARLNDQTVNAARYSALEDLRSRYVFDLEEEKERCKYNKMSDANFAKRLDRIKEVYNGTNVRQFDPTRISVPFGVIQEAPTADPVRYQADKELQIEEAVARQASLNAQSGKYQSAAEIRREVVAKFSV